MNKNAVVGTGASVAAFLVVIVAVTMAWGGGSSLDTLSDGTKVAPRSEQSSGAIADHDPLPIDTPSAAAPSVASNGATANTSPDTVPTAVPASAPDATAVDTSPAPAPVAPATPGPDPATSIPTPSFTIPAPTFTIPAPIFTNPALSIPLAPARSNRIPSQESINQMLDGMNAAGDALNNAVARATGN